MKENDINELIRKQKDKGIIRFYSLLMREMKKRKIVRSNNIIGDLGEKIAIDIYNKTRSEVNLQVAPIGTKNVDALSKMGERYNIKTIRYPNITTGVFWGLNPPNSSELEKKLFEYVIIAELTEYLEPITIYEINWDTFMKHKKWHSRTRAWTLHLTQELKSECRIVFHVPLKKK